MNPAILTYAFQLLETIPALLAAGKNITSLVSQGTAALKTMQAENRAPTTAEWDALNATIKALRDELHAA